MNNKFGAAQSGGNDLESLTPPVAGEKLVGWDSLRKAEFAGDDVSEKAPERDRTEWRSLETASSDSETLKSQEIAEKRSQVEEIFKQSETDSANLTWEQQVDRIALVLNRRNDGLSSSRNVEVPRQIREMSPEAQEYWRKQSETLGCNALEMVANAFTMDFPKLEIYEPFTLKDRINLLRTGNKPGIIEPPALEECFDAQGMPTKELFDIASPLMCQMSQTSLNHLGKFNLDRSDFTIEKKISILKFAQEHANQMNSGCLKTLVEQTKQLDLTDLDAMSSTLDNINYYVYSNHDEGFFTKSGRPTKAFWKAAILQDDTSLLRTFPDYRKHYSARELTCLDMSKESRKAIWYYSEPINKVLTNDGKLNSKILRKAEFGNGNWEDLVAAFPEQAAKVYSPAEVQYLEAPSDYRYVVRSEALGVTRNLDDDDAHRRKVCELISKYFDAEGAKPEFFQEAYSQGEFDILSTLDAAGRERAQLSANQQLLIDKYATIEDPVVKVYYADIAAKMKLDNFTPEIVDAIADVSNRVCASNAIELRRSGGYFVRNIAQTENPIANFDTIEEIFLHNNLPYAGKVFRSFQVIHPLGQGGVYSADVVKRGVLAELPDTGLRSKEAVLFNDLMRANIDSNSFSMREWIKQMRAQNVDYYRTAYNQLPKGQEQPLMQDAYMAEISDKLQTTARYDAADRLVRSFGFGLGLKSLDDLERRMDIKVAEADARGRRRFETGDFSLRKGDLVKAIDERYFGEMLQNGVVCKEFLNGAADSDATPLDADLTILSNVPDGSVAKGIAWKNQHAAFAAMRVNLVLKRDERFVTEDDEKIHGYQPEKMTIWDNGESNAGIRVGFPSTAIDFITFDTDGASSADERSYLCMEIAKNGFYIPIVDQNTGKCIFTPEEFDAMRRKLSGLERYGAKKFQFASNEALVDNDVVAIAEQLDQHSAEVERQRGLINKHIERVLADSYEGFKGLKAQADGDLTLGYVELIDTGSTGRQTSVPGSEIDFDFIMRVDARDYNDSARLEELRQIIRDGLRAGVNNSTMNGLRLADVEVPGIEQPVKVDISLVQRTNQLEFSSDQAVAQRLRQIESQDPERYKLVLANIIKAKNLLKSVGAYKPRTSSDTDDDGKKGGLGGIGIENWILQNGGSLKQAAQEFVTAAQAAGGDWQKFQKIYAVWDAGQNHFAIRDNETSGETHYGSGHKIPFDNFVARNMSESGFKRMTKVLQEYLES